MCESCRSEDPKYYLFNGNCEKCSTDTTFLWFLLPVLIGLAYTLYRLFNYIYSHYLNMKEGEMEQVVNFYRAVLTLASVLTLFTYIQTIGLIAAFDFEFTFFHELLKSWLGFFSFDMIQLTSVECQWKMTASERMLMEITFLIGLAVPLIVGWFVATVSIAIVKAEETEDDADLSKEGSSPTKRSCGSRAAFLCLQILRSKPMQQLVPPTPTKKKPPLGHLESRKRIESRIPLRRHVKERCTQLLIALYMLLYEPTVSRFAEAFNCPGGYLSLDPTIECDLQNDSRYRPLFAAGLICITLVNVVPLLGFAHALRAERVTGAMDLDLLQEHSSAQVRCFKRYGTLFMPFEPQYYYWQLCVMVRKLLLALIVKCGTGSPSVQFAFGSLVLGSALGAQYKCQPFLIQDQDDLEQIELAASIIVLLVVGTNDQLSSDDVLLGDLAALNGTSLNGTVSNSTAINSTTLNGAVSNGTVSNGTASSEGDPYTLASTICVCVVCVSLVWIVRKIWGIGAAAKILAERKIETAMAKRNHTDNAGDDSNGLAPAADGVDGAATSEGGFAADMAPIRKDMLEAQLDPTEHGARSGRS
jgi:hypothetical protein